MRRVLLVVCLVAPLAAACHTISEEAPNRPSPIDVVAAIPIISIPVPGTTPVTTPVVVTPTPAPVPTAAPSVAPTAPPDPEPEPAPEPEPEPEPDAGGENRNPVARMACSVYFVECDGQVMPGSGHASSAPVGCRVHLDATPKDASGEHTYRTEPRWVFSDPGMIEMNGRNSYNPAFTGLGRHHQTIYAEADGVRCNSFTVDVY